jgi:hypothetical protein
MTVAVDDQSLHALYTFSHGFTPLFGISGVFKNERPGIQMPDIAQTSFDIWGLKAHL